MPCTNNLSKKVIHYCDIRFVMTYIGYIYRICEFVLSCSLSPPSCGKGRLIAEVASQIAPVKQAETL